MLDVNLSSAIQRVCLSQESQELCTAEHEAQCRSAGLDPRSQREMHTSIMIAGWREEELQRRQFNILFSDFEHRVRDMWVQERIRRGEVSAIALDEVMSPAVRKQLDELSLSEMAPGVRELVLARRARLEEAWLAHEAALCTIK